MKRHIGNPDTLCGEPGTVDNVLPDCEACQMVEASLTGSSVEDIADAHSMPVSLARDVLRSCARRRAS